MMKEKVLTLVMLAGCVILSVSALIIGISEDKKAPVITIQDRDNEFTYTEGEDESDLLKGVTAKDNRDGDLTSKVFIDSISVTSDGQNAVVKYAVIDSHHNVGSKTRIVTYKTSQENEESEKTDTTENANQQQEMQEKQENTETQLKPNGEVPAIRLKETSLTINRGEVFDPVSVVDQVVDNKDSTSALFRSIHAEGEYNTNVSGTYTIKYYVTDSDKNSSEAETFTLIVK